MTSMITAIKIASLLPTGELKIARTIRLNCRRKPKLAALASEAVPMVFAVRSVTLLALCHALQLYTVEPRAHRM